MAKKRPPAQNEEDDAFAGDLNLPLILKFLALLAAGIAGLATVGAGVALMLGSFDTVRNLVAIAVFAALGGILLHFSRRDAAGNAPQKTDVVAAIAAIFGVVLIAAGLREALVLRGGVQVVEYNGFVIVGFGVLAIVLGVIIKLVFSVPPGKKWLVVEDCAYAGTCKIKVPEGLSAVEEEHRRQKWRERQFARRPDWIRSPIVTDRGRMGKAVYWVPGVLWAIALAMWGGVVVDFVHFVAAGLVTMVAAFSMIPAVRVYLHRRKFAPSFLVVDPMPLRLGANVDITVATGINRTEAGKVAFNVALHCLHEFIVRGGPDRGDRREVRSLWMGSKRVVPMRREGSDVLHLATTLSVPRKKPPSTLQQTSGEQVFWRISVTGLDAGSGYDVSFTVPVLDKDTYLDLDELDPKRTHQWGR